MRAEGRERIEEGQFDECAISMRDLRVTEDSFISALAAVFHPRVEYPQPTDHERAERHVPAPPVPSPTVPSGERGEDDA